MHAPFDPVTPRPGIYHKDRLRKIQNDLLTKLIMVAFILLLFIA